MKRLTLRDVDLSWERQYLRRSNWGSFPDILIHSSESAAKRHSLYSDAKAGDVIAAEGLVEDLISPQMIFALKEQIGTRNPFLVPVHALEAEGMNVIPRVFAKALARFLSLDVYSGIIQINRVSHTSASGNHRLAFPAVFDGSVISESFVMVDDFVGQGGTLANLKGFIENSGGMVIAATTLTGRADSAKLNLEKDTLTNLRSKHGKHLEEWWIDTFGFGLEKLTESEARYLRRIDDTDSISARLVAARGAGN